MRLDDLVSELQLMINDELAPAEYGVRVEINGVYYDIDAVTAGSDGGVIEASR